MHLGTGVKEVGTGHARPLGRHGRSLRAASSGAAASRRRRSPAGCGLAQGRGGRVDVEPDLTVAGSPGVYVVGDIANIPGADGKSLPQLGSVALQSGDGRRRTSSPSFEGKPRKEFRYKDKGIMAMIGRGAAIAEVGKHHHEVHGELAHMAWLGVHASLMTGTRAKIEAFIDWALGRVHQDRRPPRPRPRRRRRDRLGGRPEGRAVRSAAARPEAASNRAVP